MTSSSAQEHRLQNRRRRRWNRRARILAPFAALPLLLATLLLSVDIVEYRPEEPSKQPADASMNHETLEAGSIYSTRAAISTAALVAKNPIAGFESEDVLPYVVDLDLDVDVDVNLDLPPLETETLRTPTAPYTPRP